MNSSEIKSERAVFMCEINKSKYFVLLLHHSNASISFSAVMVSHICKHFIYCVLSGYTTMLVRPAGFVNDLNFVYNGC